MDDVVCAVLHLDYPGLIDGNVPFKPTYYYGNAYKVDSDIDGNSQLVINYDLVGRCKYAEKMYDILRFLWREQRDHEFDV